MGKEELERRRETLGQGMSAFDRIRETVEQPTILVDEMEMDDLITAREGLQALVERLDEVIHSKRRLESPAVQRAMVEARAAAARGEGRSYSAEEVRGIFDRERED